MSNFYRKSQNRTHIVLLKKISPEDDSTFKKY
uniref:Uncharacterized protein n=1 Tax=Setaria italica TaxID=4555 RepID=K3YNX6_SETIT